MFQEATAFYTIAAVGNATQPIRQPIRLTRRGRVLFRILLFTVMVAIALALTMVTRAAITSDAPSGGMVVVAPGRSTNESARQWVPAKAAEAAAYLLSPMAGSQASPAPERTQGDKNAGRGRLAGTLIPGQRLLLWRSR